MDRWAKIVLLLGVGLSVMSFTVGYIVRMVSGNINFSGDFVNMGMAILLFTPIVRLFITSIVMLKEKDYRHAFATVFVILLIGVGLFIATL